MIMTIKLSSIASIQQLLLQLHYNNYDNDYTKYEITL